MAVFCGHCQFTERNESRGISYPNEMLKQSFHIYNWYNAIREVTHAIQGAFQKHVE